MFYHSKILGIKEDDKGTHLKILIPGEQVQDKILKVRSGKIINSEIRIDDNRTITAEQRKKVYATIRDIANYTGHMPEELKELMKYNYMIESGENYFSLSDCSITTARLFINYLIEFCFQWDIPILDSGLDRTDDIGKYLWLCIKYKKCCICGGKAEIHHWDAVGMGNNRNKIDDSNHRKIALCEKHHMFAADAVHNEGRDSFEKKYHVYGIIYKE